MKRFEFINRLKKEKGITTAQLSEISGVNLSTLEKLSAGYNINPKLDTMLALCRALGCSLNDFGNGIKNKDAPAVSAEAMALAWKYEALDAHGREIVGLVLHSESERMGKRPAGIGDENLVYLDLAKYSTPVSAGVGADLLNEEPEFIHVVKNIYTQQADFILRVRGNSMEPKFFNDDIILVQEVPEVEIGEIGIYIINELGYVKEYQGDRLRSLNERYEDIYFGEFDNIRCVGRVVGKLDPNWIRN